MDLIIHKVARRTCLVGAVDDLVGVAVVERVCHSHHMQLLSGCPPLIYWAGSYAWDLLMHSCVCVLAMLIFVIYQDKATTATPQQASAWPTPVANSHLQ